MAPTPPNTPDFATDPFADLAQSGTDADPFANLTAADAGSSDPFADLAFESPADSDPFADLGAAPQAGVAPQAGADDPFADLPSAAPVAKADPFADLGAMSHSAADDPFADLPSAAPVAKADPFADLGAMSHAVADDPFADLPSAAPAAKADPFADLGAMSHAVADDPFADLPSAAPAAKADPFADLGTVGEVAEEDADPFADLGADLGAAPQAEADDPFADLPHATPAASDTHFDDLPEAAPVQAAEDHFGVMPSADPSLSDAHFDDLPPAPRQAVAEDHFDDMPDHSPALDDDHFEALPEASPPDPFALGPVTASMESPAMADDRQAEADPFADAHVIEADDPFAAAMDDEDAAGFESGLAFDAPAPSADPFADPPAPPAAMAGTLDDGMFDAAMDEAVPTLPAAVEMPAQPVFTLPEFPEDNRDRALFDAEPLYSEEGLIEGTFLYEFGDPPKPSVWKAIMAAKGVEPAAPGEVRRFLFDNDFEPVELPEPEPEQEMEIEEEEAPPPPPTFSEEELAQARAQGFAEGQRQGFTQGQSAALAAIENRIAGAVEQVLQHLPVLLADRDRAVSAVATEAARLGHAIAARLMPEFARRHGLTEIEAVIRQAVDVAVDRPRILVHMNPDLAGRVGERVTPLARARGFDGRVEVMGDQLLGPSDVRVEWADGGAERLLARAWADVDGIVAKALTRLGDGGGGMPIGVAHAPDRT